MNEHHPDLQRLLAAAADDADRPLRVDPVALLARASASDRRRRRQRAAGAAGSVVALTVGAVLVVPALVGGEPPVPASAPPTQSPATAAPDEPAGLPAAEVVRRCEPQLAKYRELPMYSQGRHVVAHPRSYEPGDVVALDSRDGNGNPVLCVVPEAGAEDEPVPFERFLPDAEDRLEVAEVCAEVNQPTPPPSWFLPRRFRQTDDDEQPTWTDLRTAKVTRVDQEGVVTTAVLERGAQAWQCTLSPASWDVGLTEVQPTVRGPVYLTGSATGASGKSIVAEEATWYTAAGLTDPRAATLLLRFADGTTAQRPVERGRYAVVVRVPGGGGVQGVDVDVLDADGDVLASYPAP
ncbi:hypothetical protein [Nocardioides nanhaiensis]|uniref:Ig-like domain-containing protein n=1 Tax=Nocardioides nanhaiensis TaxID=1476871 RepID=A0ABP8VWY2_9ACTN